MLSHYHKGIFGLTLKGRWGCCGSPQRAAPGCSPVPVRERESLTERERKRETGGGGGGGGREKGGRDKEGRRKKRERELEGEIVRGGGKKGRKRQLGEGEI